MKPLYNEGELPIDFESMFKKVDYITEYNINVKTYVWRLVPRFYNTINGIDVTQKLINKISTLVYGLKEAASAEKKEGQPMDNLLDRPLCVKLVMRKKPTIEKNDNGDYYCIMRCYALRYNIEDSGSSLGEC